MTLAILCSGQGAQHAAMFDLVAGATEADPIFKEAADLLAGQDPREVVRSASAETLTQNRMAQILCVTQALALQAALGGVMPARRIVAGCSVGEMSAWALTGVITPAETLRLTALRAEAMDAASQGEEGLLFVRGLSQEHLETLCAETEAQIAIINPGNGYVVGGESAALDRLESRACEAGAVRTVRLAVHVASHTGRLSAAEPRFAEGLAKADMTLPAPGVRLISGLDGGAVFDLSDGRRKLAEQISHTVQWARCLEACHEAGATAFLETGPGDGLSAMVRDLGEGTAARSAADFTSLEGLCRWIERVADSPSGADEWMTA
jgi:[acyl-carrier-protein] S-malonyltransferase